MSSGDFSAPQVSATSFRYTFLRGLARIWVSLFFRKTRTLNPEMLPDRGPAILVVGHPGSFLDAVLLVTAFQRQVRCLLDRRLLAGAWRSLLAWFLCILPYEPEGDGLRQSMERACEVLLAGQALLVFAEEQVGKPGEPPHFSTTPAAIALEAESRISGELGLEVFPVHLFLPVAQLYFCELLVHIEPPLVPAEFLDMEGDNRERARELTREIEEACRRNVFGFRPEDLQHFLSDLEDVLRTELEEDWATRPNWKQTVEGFALSRFVAEWVEQMNGLHPGQLVALRDLLDSYREAHRRCSLAQLEVDQSGEWITTSWRRVVAWTEGALGLPIAAFGLVNHVLPILILARAGLLQKKPDEAQKVKWVYRALVVVGCYAIQILLCANFMGRIAAGYYALLLPLSGAYLWRYVWFMRHRLRPLFLHLRTARESARLVRMRKNLIREVNVARDAYVEMLGLAH